MAAPNGKDREDGHMVHKKNRTTLVFCILTPPPPLPPPPPRMYNSYLAIFMSFKTKQKFYPHGDSTPGIQWLRVN